MKFTWSLWWAPTLRAQQEAKISPGNSTAKKPGRPINKNAISSSNQPAKEPSVFSWKIHGDRCSPDKKWWTVFSVPYLTFYFSFAGGSQINQSTRNQEVMLFKNLQEIIDRIREDINTYLYQEISRIVLKFISQCRDWGLSYPPQWQEGNKNQIPFFLKFDIFLPAEIEAGGTNIRKAPVKWHFQAQIFPGKYFW